MAYADITHGKARQRPDLSERVKRKFCCGNAWRELWIAALSGQAAAGVAFSEMMYTVPGIPQTRTGTLANYLRASGEEQRSLGLNESLERMFFLLFCCGILDSNKMYRLS